MKLKLLPSLPVLFAFVAIPCVVWPELLILDKHLQKLRKMHLTWAGIAICHAGPTPSRAVLCRPQRQRGTLLPFYCEVLPRVLHVQRFVAVSVDEFTITSKAVLFNFAYLPGRGFPRARFHNQLEDAALNLLVEGAGRSVFGNGQQEWQAQDFFGAVRPGRRLSTLWHLALMQDDTA